MIIGNSRGLSKDEIIQLLHNAKTEERKSIIEKFNITPDWDYMQKIEGKHISFR